MKNIVKPGDCKQYKKVVSAEDVASFHGKIVHPVCSTFTLAREIEWTTRLFVLEMCEEGEEGIGTFLSIEHKSPAFVGEEIVFTAHVDELKNHELICTYEARVDERIIALGKTGQKILRQERINEIFKQ